MGKSPSLPEGTYSVDGTPQEPVGKNKAPARRNRSSRFDLSYGRRNLRAYPITEHELGGLAALGVFAGLAFSLSAGLLGFAIDLHKDLAITADVPAKEQIFWGTVRTGGFVLSIILAGVGCYLLHRGNTKLTRIKQETVFDD